MNAASVITNWPTARVRRIHEQHITAGKASAAARRARGDLHDQMRRLAPVGGRARIATMSAEHKHKLAVTGGRAGWAKLTTEEARAKRSKAGEASKLVITHEQRVVNGRLGAAVRWRNA